MIAIDGSQGEGGGQVLRTALSLSVLTGRPFRIDHIRGRRPRPGLQRQHLTSVEAAAAICGAKTQGAELRSQTLTFRPGPLVCGAHAFDVGTAGSATLVLQTVLPPLLVAPAPSDITVRGGTHNPLAPPFDFLDRTFRPLIERLGPTVALTLHAPGFYPAGGGHLTARVVPVPALGRLDLCERGEVRRVSARALVSQLPVHVAERELRTLQQRLDLPDDALEVVEVPRPRGPGNALLVAVESDALTEVVTALGERGVPAEKVAHGAANEVSRYLAHGAPVGEHLADQLLLPLCLAGAGRFVSGPLSLHTTTNIDVIRAFLDVPIVTVPRDRRAVEVRIGRDAAPDAPAAPPRSP